MSTKTIKKLFGQIQKVQKSELKLQTLAPGCKHLTDKASCRPSPPLLYTPLSSFFSLFVAFAGLKGHLQYFVSEPVAVQTGDGHGRVLVVGHGDEAEALALVGVEVADDFDVCDGAKGAEHLPEDGFVRLLAEVVDENAPAVVGAGGDTDAAHTPHVIDAHGGEPEIVR